MPISFALLPVSWLGEVADNIRLPRMSAPLRYSDSEFGDDRREVHYSVLGCPQVGRVVAVRGEESVRALDAKGNVLREYRAGYLPPPEGLTTEVVAASMEAIEAYLSERAAGRLV